MAENSGGENRWTHLREIVLRTRGLWWTGGAIALTALGIVILWKVPQWQVARYSGLTSSQWFDHVNEARKTLATILGGVVVLAGGFATWRNLKLTQESLWVSQRGQMLAQESLRVSQEGQITDRFTRAIEQLGAVHSSGQRKLEVRLGGIYALERIANQSERDHWPIMEVLCTYVRENAPRRSEKPSTDEQNPPPENQAASLLVCPAADIQAIITVLGRRDLNYEREKQVLDLHNIDVHGANLSGADLSGANFYEADLSGVSFVGAKLMETQFIGAILRNANFLQADLRVANFRWANLSGAVFFGADLRKAAFGSVNLSSALLSEANLSGAYFFRSDLSGQTLSEADLSGAFLSEANLSGANLTHANLSKANLSGANLTHANLSEANLSGANLSRAVFRDADLLGTDLGGAVLYQTELGATDLLRTKGLMQGQVDIAKGDNTTQLPADLHMPESWKK